MNCPSCQAEVDYAAEICFNCRHVLAAVTRGTLIASRYEVMSLLGRGGMGTVYKAHDRVLDETVALKLRHPDASRDSELARRFRSEIKLARKVTHKNVCRIHEYGEDRGLRYISMEYVEGIDLKQHIRQRGALPLEEAFEIAIQLAQGLEAIHEVGIIHRDLKTPNIMRNARGLVKLMDFGIAKQVGSDITTGATVTGQVMGTPEYMSPEQARGQKVDVRTDIYALGIVIYEIFTGQVPFRGETPMATLFLHIQEPPPLSGSLGARIPRPVVPVLSRSLAKEPDLRFNSASQVAEALRDARESTLAGSKVPTYTSPPTAPASPVETEEPTAARPLSPAQTSVPILGETEALFTPSTQFSGGPPGTPQRGALSGPVVDQPGPPVSRGRPARARVVWLGLAITAVAVAVVWLRAREDAASPPARLSEPRVSSPSGFPSSAPEPSPFLAAPASRPPTPATGVDQGSRSPTAPSAMPPAGRSSSARPAAKPSSTAAPLSPARASAVATPIPQPPTALAATEASPTPAPIAVATPTPAPAPPVTAQEAGAPPVEERGVLQLMIVPFAEASIDDVSRGQVSSSKFPLSAGTHVLVLSHPDYQPLRRRITIVPGETLKLIVDMAEEAIRKRK